MREHSRCIWLAILMAGCQNTKGSTDGTVPEPIENISDGEGDGFLDDDCDDSNSDVNPDAEEVP